MGRIKITQKGKFSKVEMYFNKLLNKNYKNVLAKYAEEGLKALKANTPVRTGLTASSWDYHIEETKDKISIVYTNSNVNKHVNVALLIQYGHGTGTGGWVEGVDYINPALKPVFQKLLEECRKEVRG